MWKEIADATGILVVPLVAELVAASPWFGVLKRSRTPRILLIMGGVYVFLLASWLTPFSSFWRELGNWERLFVMIAGAGFVFVTSLVIRRIISYSRRRSYKRRAPIRCDSEPDWYMNKPIAGLHLYDDAPLSDARDHDGELARSCSSAWQSLRHGNEGRVFTLDRFRDIQAEIIKSGVFEDSEDKWGFETLAFPSVPCHDSVDPTQEVDGGGCMGVGLLFVGRRYLPSMIQERPLRLVE